MASKCTHPRWGVPPSRGSEGGASGPDLKLPKKWQDQGDHIHLEVGSCIQDLSCHHKALTWIAASSSPHLESEGRTGLIPDSPRGPPSFRVCSTGTKLLWRLHQLPQGTPGSLPLPSPASHCRLHGDQPLFLQLSQMDPWALVIVRPSLNFHQDLPWPHQVSCRGRNWEKKEVAGSHEYTEETAHYSRWSSR